MEGVESGCLLHQYKAVHVILMAAAACLMLSFSSCDLQCPHRILWGHLESAFIRIKSAHDTGTKGQHHPRTCSHQNHYVTSGIPQNVDSTTVD